jgi:hypothetical protein
VIADDRDVERVALMPPEADPPLIIDPDTVLSRPIPLELLEAVARRRSEIFELLGRVKHHQFAEHEMQEFGGEASDALPLKKALRVAIREARDHSK